jgi:hypothetical protein
LVQEFQRPLPEDPYFTAQPVRRIFGDGLARHHGLGDDGIIGESSQKPQIVFSTIILYGLGNAGLKIELVNQDHPRDFKMPEQLHHPVQVMEPRFMGRRGNQFLLSDRLAFKVDQGKLLAMTEKDPFFLIINHLY